MAANQRLAVRQHSPSQIAFRDCTTNGEMTCKAAFQQNLRIAQPTTKSLSRIVLSHENCVGYQLRVLNACLDTDFFHQTYPVIQAFVKVAMVQIEPTGKNQARRLQGCVNSRRIAPSRLAISISIGSTQQKTNDLHKIEGLNNESIPRTSASAHRPLTRSPIRLGTECRSQYLG